jgi:oligopeptide transport system substrate-binding protein
MSSLIQSLHLASIAACCLLLAGCGRQEVEPAPDRAKRPRPVELVIIDGRPDPSVLAAEQILHRGNGEEPQTLDPHKAEGVPASQILRDLYEGLTAEAPDGSLVPGAAARWNISRDGRTYTFYLRRDARWSNGDPLRADDFVFGLRRSAAPDTASNYAQVLLPIQNAREVLTGELPPSELGVTALDEFTLQIQLTDPTPYFLGLLNHSSTYPVHRSSLQEHGSRFSRPGNLVSNGAFVLTDWSVRSRIVLERNVNYWDADNVILEQVVYYPYEDQSTELKQFRSGELQWTNEVPNNQFRWLQKHYPEELVVSPWLGSYFFGFNLTREPFIESPELRLALVLAVNRELLTEKVTQFGEQPSYTLVPPGIGDYESPLPEWAGWSQAQREDEARRLFALAGYSEERPLRVEIRYNTSENHKKVALAVASMWKQVLGVQVSLVNEEWKVFLQNRAQRVVTQVFRAGWISDYSDPYSFLQLFRTGHGQNDYGYSDELYDQFLQEIASERIPARRRRLMQEAERMILTDLPILPVYTYVTKRLVDPRVSGWANNVMDHHYSKHMFLLKDAPEQAAATLPETSFDATTEGQTVPPPAGAGESKMPEAPPGEDQPMAVPAGEASGDGPSGEPGAGPVDGEEAIEEEPAEGGQ